MIVITCALAVQYFAALLMIADGDVVWYRMWMQLTLLYLCCFNFQSILSNPVLDFLCSMYSYKFIQFLLPVHSHLHQASVL